MNNVKVSMGIAALVVWFVVVIAYLLSRPNIWTGL